MSKEIRRWAMLGGFMEIADTPGNEAPSGYTRYVRETDHKEVVDALLAERDRLRETLKGFPGFLCGTATGDKWIEQKRAALQGAQP